MKLPEPVEIEDSRGVPLGTIEEDDDGNLLIRPHHECSVVMRTDKDGTFVIIELDE